ncbi:helix-turn-helix transcriptional regulator [Hymenobacter sp. BT559]|nr:helix-turn-helix transcriptional regulator [Hymenobacter sp. BT559]
MLIFLIQKSKCNIAEPIEMNNLESKIKNRLAEQGMTIQRLATVAGISEPTLHAIFNRGDAKLSQLEKIAEALSSTLNFLLSEDNKASTVQTGDFNQAGSGNSQKVKVDKGKPQQDLAAALAACQRELALANALVAAKDETITLLRASFTRPN